MSEILKVKILLKTVPRLQKEAPGVALQMSQSSMNELERLLRINAKIAVENYKRYQAFHAEGTLELPVLLTYTGIVFKRLNAKDFSKVEFEYTQEHLRLTFSCYGLLKPLDVIRSYRLEEGAVLSELGDQVMSSYWQSRLTDVFIGGIKKAGDILYSLVSDEMKSLFGWKWVEKEVHVITPGLQVWKNGKLVSIVIYIKTSRGKMTWSVLKN